MVGEFLTSYCLSSTEFPWHFLNTAHQYIDVIMVSLSCTQVPIKRNQFSSVAKLCPTVCDPMNHSTPGLPVHHQLPEFTQIHVHQSVMPSSHLILCRPLLLLPPIPPSIRVFSSGQLFAWGGQSIGVSALASVLPMKTQDWSPSEWTGWISLQSKGLSRVFSNTTVQKHQFFGVQLSLWSNSHIHTWLLRNHSSD